MSLTKKKIKFGLASVFSLVIFICIYAISSEDSNQNYLTPTAPVIEKEEVEKWLKQREELSWFSSVVESETNFHKIPSQLVFNRSVPSFDRIWMQQKSLQVILEGKYDDYLEFISFQSKEQRLDWSQFQNLQEHARTLIANCPKLTSIQVREILELAFIFSEIGHTEIARNKAWVYEISSDNCQNFIEVAIKVHPNIFPSYEKLSLLQQEILCKIIPLLHFDEVTKLNGGLEAFKKVKQSEILKNQVEIFELALLVHLCQLSGLGGNECCSSSPFLTSHAMKNINILRKSFFLLREHSIKEAYQFYLFERADMLGLDPGSPLNRVLTKVGAMMNLYTTSEGKILKSAFLKLTPDELTSIIEEFDDLYAQKPSNKMTEIALLLAHWKQNTKCGLTEKDKLSKSIFIEFPLIAKALKEKKEQNN